MTGTVNARSGEKTAALCEVNQPHISYGDAESGVREKEGKGSCVGTCSVPRGSG